MNKAGKQMEFDLPDGASPDPEAVETVEDHYQLPFRRDLTQGSILKGVWSLAAPNMVARILQMGDRILDVFWLGRLGSEALAVLALGTTVLMVVMTARMGISMGARAVVARYWGAGDHNGARRAAAQALLLGGVFAIVFAAGGYFLAPFLMHLFGAETEVASIGTKYVRIAMIGSVGFSLGMASRITLQAVGDAITPMKLQFIRVGTHALITPFLIFGWWVFPKMGVYGAALAFLLTEATVAVLGLWILFSGVSIIKVNMADMRPDRQLMWTILKIGIPSSIQMSTRSLVAAVLTGIVARYGTPVLAAYAVGQRFQMMVLMPANGFGLAAGTMVGQNLGSGNPARAERSGWTAVANYMVFAVGMAVLSGLFARQIMGLFNSEAEVIQVGTSYIRIIVLSFPFLCLSQILASSLQGAGDTIPPMIITTVTSWIVDIPLALTLPSLPIFGVSGLWWAIAIGYSTRGLLITGWFKLGRWKLKTI